MKKIISILLLTLMMFAMFTGCDKADGQKNDKELTTVRVSEFRGLNWSATYAADLLGYFEEEGIKIEYAIYKDGPVAFQGMHAGDSDFCLLSAEPVMRAFDEGMQSYFVLTNTNNRTYAFAGAPEIKDVKDLKGKTVFAGMPGSAPYSFVLSILSSAGLSENDVNFINMEYGAAIIALAEGQVDGIFYDIYSTKELLQAVPGVNVLVDTTNPETHKNLYNTEFCQTTIVTSTKKFVDENPETVQKFVNAHVKALKWINEHSIEEVAKLLTPMFEGMTEEEFAEKFATVKSSFSATGEINEEGYKSVEDFCYEQGLIKERIGFENIVASQFVKKALENIK